jgi:beta-glucosidase
MIDTRARNVLEFVKRASKAVVAEEESTRDFPEDRALNRKLAAESVVLLKNEVSALPLKRDFKSIALIGPNMKTAAFCGGGSAALRPYYTVSPYQGIVEYLSEDVTIRYEPGALSSRFLPTLSAPQITTPDGQPGCRITYFCDPPSVANRKAVHQAVFPDTNWLLLGSQSPDLGPLFYADVEASFVAPCSADFEFGLAVYGTADLFVDGERVIDNTTIQKGGVFFFAKGTREEKAVVSLQEGRRYAIKVEFGNGPSSTLVKPGIVDFGGGGGRIGCRQVVDEDALIERAVQAAKDADVTILCAGLTVSSSTHNPQNTTH